MFKNIFQNESFRPSRLIWFGPNESLPESSSALDEVGGLKEKMQSNRHKIIIFLDNWKPYELGGWKDNNENVALALGIENTKEGITSIQALVGVKNPDGKIGPSSAYAIAKYLNLKMNPSHFPRKSTRDSLSEFKNEVEVVRNIEDIKSRPEQMYLYFVDALNKYRGEDSPSFGPSKEVFVNNFERVIDHTQGNIDFHDLKSWYEAFISAGVDSQEIKELSLDSAMDAYNAAQLSNSTNENSPLDIQDGYSPELNEEHPYVMAPDSSPLEGESDSRGDIWFDNSSLEQSSDVLMQDDDELLASNNLDTDSEELHSEPPLNYTPNETSLEKDV